VGERTKIGWTQSADGTPGDTLNPIRYRNPSGKSGHICLKYSPGCDNCYASRLQGYLFTGQAFAAETTATQAALRAAIADGRLYLDERMLARPIRQQRQRRIFMGSMTDLFGSWIPREWQIAMWAMMACAPQHTFQVLTKRANELHAFLTAPGTRGAVAAARTRFCPTPADEPMPWPLPNVWCGVSVESDAYAWRAAVLSRTPAAVRWVSAEPLLGPIPHLPLPIPCPSCDTPHLGNCDAPYRAIDWLVVGGESGGPAARRLVEPYTTDGLHANAWGPKSDAVAWVRDLRDRAHAAGVAIHFKQWGGPRPTSGGRLLDGRTWDEWPDDPARRAAATAAG
jgi:protein gp37